MKISEGWLRDYVDHPYSVDELADALTMSGLEVEEIIRPTADLSGIVVGKVLDVSKHPDADKLSVCSVDAGTGEPLSIVCGASNVASGQKVAVATIGSSVSFPAEDGTRKTVKIKKSKLRGVVSHGMICAEDELGLGDDHAGIMVLGDEAVVGEGLSEYLERSGKSTSDPCLDIAITPNRPDAISHIGVARDVSTLAKTELKRPKVEIPSSGGDVAEMISVFIDSPDACSRYVATAVQSVVIKDSPAWLKARLETVGLRAINNVVDVTNYVMLECGQPLHAFDYEFIRQKTIRVRTTSEPSTFTTLDGKERDLPSGTPMICDGDGEIAIAGIMGGANSEVSGSTTTVLIESAYFDPTTTRRFAKALDMQTDASYRFERGVDPEGQAWAAARAAELIADLSGGQVVRGIVDVQTSQPDRLSIRLRVARVERIVGVAVPRDEIVRLLTGIGFEVAGDDDVLTCKVPSFRPDITREIDVIEEVIRLYGFDKVPEPTKIKLPAVAPSADRDRRQDIRNLLSGVGFREIVTNSLLASDTAALYNDPNIFGDKLAGDVVQTENAINRGMTTLRPSLLPKAVEVSAFNFNHGQSGLRLFEIGHVFRKGNAPKSIIPGYIEHESIVLAMTGRVIETSWNSEPRNFDFFDIKGAVGSLLQGLNLDPVYTEEASTIAEDALAISVDDRHVGLVGRLSAKGAGSRDLRQPLFFAELNLSALFKMSSDKSHKTYVPVSRFPTVERDLAIVLDASIPAASVRSAIRKAGGRLLSNIRLFDIYTGKGVQDTQRSLAYNLVFSSDRTLKDDEVDAAISRIVDTLGKEFGAELRQ